MMARIYLSLDNKNILDKQLQETYGESFADLTRAQVQSRTRKIIVKKIEVPPLVIRKTVRRIERQERGNSTILLEVPKATFGPGLQKITYTIKETPGSERMLQQVGDGEIVETMPEMVTLFSAAMELARTYRIGGMETLQELQRIYSGQLEIPVEHIAKLAEQVEEQTRQYVVLEETVEVAWL